MSSGETRRDAGGGDNDSTGNSTMSGKVEQEGKQKEVEDNAARASGAVSHAPLSASASSKGPAKSPPVKAAKHTKKPRKQKSNTPSRPLSAYSLSSRKAFNFFMRETKDEWLDKNRATHDPSKGSLFAAMTKAIASRWKSLSGEEADKYHKMAAQDSQRYKDEMEHYHTAEARMLRLTEGLAAGKDRSRGGDLKDPPGTHEHTSAPSTIDTSHTSRTDSLASPSRHHQYGMETMTGSHQFGSLSSHDQLLSQGGLYPLSGGAPLGLESYASSISGSGLSRAPGFLLPYSSAAVGGGGGELMIPWSQAPAAGTVPLHSDAFVQEYLIEQRVQQRYAEQRLMDQQQRVLAAEQRLMDQRAVDQMVLEQRLRQQQSQPSQLLVPAYPPATTLYYPSDPALMGAGGVALGNYGLATAASAAATPVAVQQPLYLYAPTQSVLSSLDGSLTGAGPGGSGGIGAAYIGAAGLGGTSVPPPQQPPSSIRHELLHSLAAERAQQQQALPLNRSSMPYWTTTPLSSAGLGGGPVLPQHPTVAARGGAAESETSRRLVRDLLQPSLPPSEEAAAAGTDESEQSKRGGGGSSR